MTTGVLERRRRAARLAAGLALVGGVVLAVFVHRQGGVELDPAALRERIAELGALAPIAFVLASALRFFLLLPSWVLMSAGGLLFGVVGGSLLGTLGFTLGGVFVFGVARALGRDALAGRLSGGIERMDALLTRRGPAWVGMYSALPITPLSAAHLAAGLSGMSAWRFTIAIALGLLPRTGLFSFFGDTLASGDLRQIAVAGGVVLIAMLVGVEFARRGMGRARDELPSDPGPDRG